MAETPFNPLENLSYEAQTAQTPSDVTQCNDCTNPLGDMILKATPYSTVIQKITWRDAGYLDTFVTLHLQQGPPNVVTGRLILSGGELPLRLSGNLGPSLDPSGRIIHDYRNVRVRPLGARILVHLPALFIVDLDSNDCPVSGVVHLVDPDNDYVSIMLDLGGDAYPVVLNSSVQVTFH